MVGGGRGKWTWNVYLQRSLVVSVGLCGRRTIVGAANGRVVGMGEKGGEGGQIGSVQLLGG